METGLKQGDVYDPSCSARDVLEIVAGKWPMLVLPALRQGAMRNGELLRRVKGISQKMLTQTLRDLERSGLIVRRDMQTVPPHVIYNLTPLGASLAHQFEAIDRWAEMHFLQIDAAQLDYDRRNASSSGD